MTERSRAEMLLGFLRRRGLASLSLVVEHLNRGTPHKRIAQMIDMDEAQFSRFTHAVFLREYRVAPDIADVIELHQQLEARHAQRSIRVPGNVQALAERTGNVA